MNNNEVNSSHLVSPDNINELDTQKVIDWEERRYEIAKEIMAAYNTVYEYNKWGIVEKAKMAVDEADTLIRVLKSRQ